MYEDRLATVCIYTVHICPKFSLQTVKTVLASVCWHMTLTGGIYGRRCPELNISGLRLLHPCNISHHVDDGNIGGPGISPLQLI